MGDRVTVEFTVRKKDFKRAEDLIGGSGEMGDMSNDKKVAVFFREDANYGGDFERKELQKAKIPYIAIHGTGEGYGPCIYVFDGETELEHVQLDGDLMVIVGENGNVAPEALAYAREFLKFRKKVNKILDGDIMINK